MSAAKSYKTSCSRCDVGCGVLIDKNHRDRLTLKGDSDHPSSKGMICFQEANIYTDTQNTSSRILHPEMRWSKNHPREKVSWDTALDRAAAVFKSLIKNHGPNSIGFYLSGQCLTEEYYLVNKLAKGFLGTNNIDIDTTSGMSASIISYKRALGNDNVPGTYEDLALADTLLLTSTNLSWSHPTLFESIKKRKEKNPNTKIILVNPLTTELADWSDVHLKIRPGTEVVLNNALAKRLIETKKIDLKFIQKSTNNFEALKKTVFQVSLSHAAKVCGIHVKEIKLAAKYIGNAKGFVNMWTTGNNSNTFETDKNMSLLNLSLLTGQIGKPGAGPFSLSGQPNGMGARESGVLSNSLPAHKNLADPKDRKEVADFWGTSSISSKPGLTATEMFDALNNGTLKALWIVGTDPLVNHPDSKKLKQALKKANFVILQDSFRQGETSAFADLLLPAAGWLEKEGTMTNSERRISYLPKVKNPPGETLHSVEILCRFAQKMSFPGFNYVNTHEVFDEFSLLTKGTQMDFSGLSYERLQREGGFQWPVPFKSHKGTPRLFTDHQFGTLNQKAAFNIPSNAKEQSETSSKAFPLMLLTQTMTDQWPPKKPHIEMNGVDAFKRSIKEGDLVIVKKKNKEIRIPLKINYDLITGVVFMPFPLDKILSQDCKKANHTSPSLTTPPSKESDVKLVAVEVTKYLKKPQKIVIIGTSAAAHQFVQTYREKNTIDPIDVFSKEATPFYERMLISEHISEELTWEELQELKKEELDKLKIQLHAKVAIKAIHRNEKTITDSNGIRHKYDLLILAPENHAYIPSGSQINLPGRFAIHKENGSDELTEYLKKSKLPSEEQHVIIVGGGVTGLGLAATLSQNNTNVTLVHKGARLMERQLDRVASRLLAQDMQQRGIQIYFDNEINTVFDNELPYSLSINLKTGKTLSGNALVYAVGSMPNIELAKTARLTCQRGVIVNQHLQTSDPAIFALGGIAEFQNNLYNTSDAFKQQAETAVKYILGDSYNQYEGSVLTAVLKFDKLKLCSIGTIEIPENNAAYEEILSTDISRHYYKKYMLYKNRLIGAILMGEIRELPRLKRLIENRTELSNKREELLK